MDPVNRRSLLAGVAATAVAVALPAESAPRADEWLDAVHNPFRGKTFDFVAYLDGVDVKLCRGPAWIESVWTDDREEFWVSGEVGASRRTVNALPSGA